MKMAFELNDLKGFLFLVLFTIPSTSSANYDCKGKSFYCLDSTHFLICVDFGGGVLSTIDDFVLPCPSLTECHASNTYECELPKIVPPTVVYATSVTEKSVNSVVPLIITATAVPPELTTVLPSTEKSTVVPVSEVVTSESNKEILESLKDEFTGGNEHVFEPTKFISTNSIDLSSSVNNVNKTSTTLNKNNNITADVEKKVNNSVKVLPKIIDVTTSIEGLLVTDSNVGKIYIPKSLNITYNNTDKIELNITANKLTKSKNLISDESQTTKPPTLSSNLSTDRVNVNRVYETSQIMSSTNIVPPDVTTVLPSMENNTMTTGPLEVPTVQPSTEKNTAMPALDVVTFESNKEILEKLKDEVIGGNEKIFERTSFVPPSSISLSTNVDKVNKMNTTTDKNFNPKPGLKTSTENIMKMTVTDNPKNLGVNNSIDGLQGTDLKSANFIPNSPNIGSNSTNNKELNLTTNELTTSKDLTGDEALIKTIPTPSYNLNADEAYLITLSEMSDKDVLLPINTVTIGPLEVTPMQPATKKNTVIHTLEVVTSNKEILENFKDEFVGGNEKTLESTTRVDKVSDMSAFADKKNNSKSDLSTKNIMKNVVTDNPKNIDFTTSIDGLQDTDPKSAHFISNLPNIVHITTNNKELNSKASELTKTENLTSYEAGALILPTLFRFETSENSFIPIQVTTVLPSTDKNTVVPALEVTTSKLNKEILESLTEEFTGDSEKIFKPTTATALPSTDTNTFTPALEVTTSKLNIEKLESLKDEFTGGNEKIFKPTTATEMPSTSKNTLIPALELTTSKLNKEILKNLNDEFTGGNEKIFKPTTATEMPSTSKNTLIPALELTTSKLNKEILKNLNDEFTGGNEKIFIPTTATVLPSTDKNTFTPALEVTASKLNNEILESLKDEFTGGNEKKIKPTTATEMPSTSKNTLIPALEVTASKLNNEILESLKDEFIGGNEKIFKPTTATALPSTDTNTFTPALEVTTSKLNIEILESLKDKFTGGNEKIFKPTTVTVLSSTDKNTFTPALKVTTSKLNKEILESLKDEFTGGNEKNLKPTTATEMPSTSKNTLIPALELTTSKLNKEILENLNEFTGGNEKIFTPTTATVLPSTDKNTFTPALEVTTSKLNIEILESLKDEFTGGNEKIFKNINVTESIETSTESTEKINVTNDLKIIDIGAAVEGTLITNIKNTTYTPKLQNISHTTFDARKLNITENLTSDKAPANKFHTLSSNLKSGQKYYLNNVVSFSNQTNYYYSLHNLTTPTFANEMTRDPIAITEKVVNTTEMNVNLNTNNVTDNIPTEQKVFLSNPFMLLKKNTTITPLEIFSPTVTPSNHLQMKEPYGSKPFINTSDNLNNASASTNKYETINNIDTTFSTTEPTTQYNIADNQTGQNLEVLTYRTTVSNNEQTTKVTSTTDKDTTPTEMFFFVSGDNSLTTPIPTTTYESISTTASSTTIENSITPLVDSVTMPDIYVNENEPHVFKMDDAKEVPIDLQVKSTTTLSMESSIDLTPLPEFVVTTRTSSNLLSGKESALEKQINLTTSDTIYITAFTTPQSKTYKSKSEDVNNLIVTTTENVNTKSSKINGNDNWINTDSVKANNSSNISILITEKPYGAKENNITLNNNITDPSALESLITVSSTIEPSVIIKDQAKNLNKINVIDSSSMTITSTLSSSHKIYVETDNKPTEVPSKLETITIATTIPKVDTLSKNINNIIITVENTSLTQIKNGTPDVIYTQNKTPDLKTPEYSKKDKEEQLDIFSTTVKPIIEVPLTSNNILKVTKLTSFTSQGTKNPLHSTTEVTESNSLKSDYAKIIVKSNISYPKEVKLTGYSKPDNLTSTSNTNLETATSGSGISSEISTKNGITGTNVKDAVIVNYSKQVTVPVSSEITTQLSMEVTKTQTTYHSNTFVSPAVTEFTAEQNPNVVKNRFSLVITASTAKPNIDNSSIISTVTASNSIANKNTEHIPIMAPVSMVETPNIHKPKFVLGSTISSENIFNSDTANESTFNTNLKISDKNNTTIKSAFQANTQNMTLAYKIQGNNTNKENINLETTTIALEKALLNVDIDGKSKNDKEDSESTTSYGSASRIELTTPTTFKYNNNKPVINTTYVPQSRQSQRSNINISDTQTNQKDNESKTISAKTKVSKAVIGGNNEGKANNSIQTFDCQNKTRGKYGDSKDCQKFYTCIGTLQPIVGNCPNHTVFSEINKQCTRNLSHCVRNNQFHCLYEGRFSDLLKDNIYYICVKNNFHGFLRYKLQCQGGYYLNKAIVRCEKKEEIYKESVSSISENSKISNDQNKSIIKSDESEKSVSNDFECKKEGLFPFSNDCRKYYVCSKNSKDEYRRKIKKCSSDEVYDKEKKKCVYADSIEC